MLSLQGRGVQQDGEERTRKAEDNPYQGQPLPGVSDPTKLKLCQEIFEDFCIVSQSVKAGIPVDVEVISP